MATLKAADFTDRPEMCTVSRSLDGLQTTCHWPFRFRSDAALAFSQSLEDVILECGAIGISEEKGVDHPDSYGQKQFRMPGYTISVSVKDKTALSQTLVFMSVVDLD